MSTGRRKRPSKHQRQTVPSCATAAPPAPISATAERALRKQTTAARLHGLQPVIDYRQGDGVR